MSTFFPRKTVSWQAQETPAFRRIALSLFEMGAITGIALHLFRVLYYTHGPENSGFLFFGAMVALETVALCALVTAHLGNYTLRTWAWRAPAFAGVVIAVEAVTAAVLVLAGREPYGSGLATRDDLPALIGTIAVRRLVEVIVFSAILSGVVRLVRWALLRGEQRDSAVVAVRDEHGSQSGEKVQPTVSPASRASREAGIAEDVEGAEW